MSELKRPGDVTALAEPDVARSVLVDCYGDYAGAEALLRAFLCARDLNQSGARFWITVYDLITAA